MRLVIFTLHYPYGAGEPFLEDELRVAEKEFDRILIVSSHKCTETRITRYIPHNAEVISIRSDSNDMLRRIVALRFLLTPRAIRELLHSCCERGWKKIFSNAVRVLLVEDKVHCLEKKQATWLKNESNEPTIYYSYWLGADSIYMARHRKELNGLCISRAHGGDCFFDRAYHPYRAETLKSLNAVFSISEMGRNDILQHYVSKVKSLESKIITSRMGVGLPEKQSTQSLPDDRRVLCTVSNVIPLKRLDLLIDALAEIQNVDIHWVHFGDGAIFENIKALAKEKLDAKENITYEFRGRVANTKIYEFYTEQPVDLFINCSDVEGIPVSVMEAMSFGIPAIARNVGGVSEIIDNSCGLLLPEMITPTELKEGILKVLSESNEEHQIKCNNARRKIESEYNCKKNYGLFVEHIKRMMKEHAGE